MCGVAAAVGLDAAAMVPAMLDALGHRGPDGREVASGRAAAIGAVRLAMRGDMGLSPLHRTGSGDIIAYNGEVYGASRGRGFPESPAAEVQAILFAHASGEEPDGMYAVAELAGTSARLRVRRDALGIKPLFHASGKGVHAVASEAKALAPLFGRGVDGAALLETIVVGRPIGTETARIGISEVAPGVELVLGGRAREGGGRAPEREHADAGCAEALRRSVRATLAACIQTPRRLGLAVSGGLDSAILAAELNAMGVEELTTFSVIAKGEADGIVSLAELGLPPGGAWTRWRHVPVTVDPDDYLPLTEQSVMAIDSPHRLTSAPLTVALAHAVAREGVIGLITGEGPDELFFGYEGYREMAALLAGSAPRRRTELIAGHLLAGTAIEALPPPARNRIRSRLRARLGRFENLAAAAALLESELEFSLGPLLLRNDHVFMRHGIEVRVPFLHGEAPAIARSEAGRLPLETLLDKRLVREAWADLLPAHRISRRKTPFRAPLSRWLQDDRQWKRWSGLIDDSAGAFQALGLSAPPASELRRVGGAGAVFAWTTAAMWLRRNPAGASPLRDIAGG